MKRLISCALGLAMLFWSSMLLAQRLPTGQDVGSTTRTEKAAKEQETAKKKLARGKAKVKVEGEEAVQP